MSDFTVIYNDTCPICAREVMSYKRMTARLSLDVAYSGLSDGAAARFGLSQRDAARRFHVVRSGELYSGVDAFALLWAQLPGWRWLARFVRLPLIAPLSRMVYDHILAPALFSMHRRRERLGKAHHIG